MSEFIIETPKKNTIAYYISAHGYGHGVRSCAIIRAINRLYPHFHVDVVTGLPAGILSNLISRKQNSVRDRSFDIGMVQKDSIRVDVSSTLGRLEQLYSKGDDLIAGEVSYLKEKNIALTVVDIPALPLEAAAIAGVPRVAVGNFGWDWIYSSFLDQDARWKPFVDRISNAYAKADLLLRLPFSEDMSAFPEIEDIPLVASPGTSRREEISKRLNCDAGKKWILISFTTLDWSAEALDSVEDIKEYEFITVHPLYWDRSNIHAVPGEMMPFADIVASVDAVLSKPGFGILSECIVNRKPLIYSDRSDFAEYSILEPSIKKYLKNIHIPVNTLYSGDLKPSLDRIWDQPEALAVIPHGGDVIAAQRIAQMGGVMK